ncbi:MAG TPA: hypothetical protein VL095_14720, partial [Flavisolibacter sp.]|nr:hypothetical protein [Flavisolibacter sp.]
MKTVAFKTLFSFFFCASVFFALGQPNWKLTKEKDGIRIYQRDIKNSNFKGRGHSAPLTYGERCDESGPHLIRVGKGWGP